MKIWHEICRHQDPTQTYLFLKVRAASLKEIPSANQGTMRVSIEKPEFES